MSEIIILSSGGAGSTSDDCDAKLTDVLYGKYAITSDSGDLPKAGTMPDLRTQRLELENVKVDTTYNVVIQGNLSKDTYGCVLGKADESEENEYSKFVIPITNFGDVPANCVKSGYTFTSSAGLKVDGTMTEYDGTVE